MADKNTPVILADSRENTQTSPESKLRELPRKVGAVVQKTTAAAFTGFALMVSTPVLADETPENKGVQQVVMLKDGRQMSFAEIAKLPEKEKGEILDNQMSDAQFDAWERYQKGLIQAANREEQKIDANIQAANQRNEETRSRIDGKKEALDQMKSLFALLDQLFAEQGLQMTPSEKYKSQAIIVTNVLTNPILIAKLTPDTINLLKDMETSLNKGKNPFIYMSKEGKAKLQALLRS